MTTPIIQCLNCVFFTGEKKCSVFPLGIPEEIWSGKHDHRKPFDGDGGITLEPIIEEG